HGAPPLAYLLLREVRWSEYILLSAIRLSDSCMNCLSLSSKLASPVGPFALGMGCRGTLYCLGCCDIAGLGGRLSCRCCGAGSSAFLMERFIFPSSPMPMTFTLTVCPSCT